MNLSLHVKVNKQNTFISQLIFNVRVGQNLNDSIEVENTKRKISITYRYASNRKLIWNHQKHAFCVPAALQTADWAELSFEHRSTFWYIIYVSLCIHEQVRLFGPFRSRWWTVRTNLWTFQDLEISPFKYVCMYYVILEEVWRMNKD